MGFLLFIIIMLLLFSRFGAVCEDVKPQVPTLPKDKRQHDRRIRARKSREWNRRM